jgi:tyrosine-protein kinase Etk/Wzc
MPIDTPLPEPQEHDAPSFASSAVRPIASENDEISLLDLLIVLAAKKRMIFWVSAIFALLGILISLVLPKRYTAMVTLLPPQQNSSVSAALASQLSSLGGMAAIAGGSLGVKSPNEIFVAMLKSRTVEEATIEHFGLMKEYHQRYLSDARKAFERRVTVDGSGKDGLIHISIEDRDPNRAADIANGYVAQFRTLSQHLAITEASQRRLFFEQQLELAKDNLANAEEAMKMAEQKSGMIQLDSQARALIESAASLRAQIITREVQLQGMQTYASERNAQLVQAQQELNGLRSQLAKLGGSEDSGSGGLMLPKGKVPEAGLEYVRKLRDVKYYEAIFEILARQFEMAKLDEAKQGALIQVVDSAVPPDKRSFPKRALIVVSAVVVGFFIAIFLALFQAGFRRLTDDSMASEKIALLKRYLSVGRRARSDAQA